ncbi:MAG: FtsX-like permease family protein [Dehalococcoidia bacterium]|nr:FtsX-like permease family protein [Dehalococcoidia bacterium]
MSELFGIPMNGIMVALLALLAVCLSAFAAVFLANRTMFRMGVRNIPRRRAQSILVVSGLMLATVIITAAFTTGDVIDYSATRATYDNLQRTDLSVHHFRPVEGDVPFGQTYAPESVTSGLESTFAGDPDIEGFMPFLYETVPVVNPRTSLFEPAVVMAGYDPERLTRFGGLRLVDGGAADVAGLPDDGVFLGRRLADKIDARVGDAVLLFARNEQVVLHVAGVVEDERASGILEFGPAGGLPGMAARLPVVQRITGHQAQITTVNVTLRGGVRGSLDRSDPAAVRLIVLAHDEAAKAAIGLTGITFQVETIKQDAIEGSRLAASLFTTVFLVLGLFSIAAGAMLIFTLFVMLAAERRTEMGIVRAVGGQRVHLVQAFVAEGAVYDLVAGLIGVAIGVAAALVIVVGGAKLLVGDELSVITAHVAPRSLVVSFCLGAVLTFLTVVVSSLRISQLNIVAAVRGQASAAAVREPKHRNRWLWIILGIPALILPPLGLYWLLRKGFGMPWSWIVGPGGILVGLLLVAVGRASEVAFPLTLGVSILILSVAAVAQYYGAGRRLAWSLAGVALAAYWVAPADVVTGFLGGDYEISGMEMFVLSGIMIVTGFTLFIVFNARLLTVIFAAQRRGSRRYLAPAILAVAALAALIVGLAVGHSASGLGQLGYLLAAFLAVFALSSAAAMRVPRFAPAFKMGVAYPLANRFRTGMTIAMFAIVVFSVTVMSIVNASFLDMFTSDEGRGGWDVIAATNQNNPIPDFTAALREARFDTSVITAMGSLTQYDDNAQEARTPGGSWHPYPLIAGDSAFFASASMKLDGRARGYATDRAVYDAVAGREGLALLDSAPLQSGTSFGAALLSVGGVTINDGQFDPFALEIRDPVTGHARTVTVVGILSSRIPPGLLAGVLMNGDTYRPVLGEPDYRSVYLRLAQGTDDRATARAIKAALVTRGVQAVSIREEIDRGVAASVGFLRIFQAFMALGLFVGIAALGVIALRSVVERRQQIGMLRAIGYQRGTVALSFLLESGFIAMMGILAGVVGACLLSWELVRGDAFTQTGMPFFIPWFDIGLIVALTFSVALVMTWWPSRRAASVPIAAALRYE